MEDVTNPEIPEDQTQETTWEDERAELTQRLETLTTELHSQRVNNAFYRKARAAGVDDPDALAGIVNLSAVTFDDAGQAQGIDEILTAFTSAAKPKEPRTIGGPSGLNYQERVEKTSEQRLATAAEKAKRTGRPEDMVEYMELKSKLKLQN
ncbi:hypothetical protein ASL14_09345 [Paenibacillus sp. IHB B 3084]|uniref:phage scaffolding protein n=1 Tax=Paenibacillus sp. IHB B 3084 TaxID=867076 RepID=UPI0007215FCA|nr:hypothetical protein [Paenibacillus sp. IHB B 3084]ALP36343.1 hypothetical protein ASL14_09345 [Paenibacillus sp. IHB B 3084]